ncbi:CueP family metal-binding protein [Propionimicrobium sp. PCR01-08-3]|uniref:CueP family metal-binding protein n=1 Tax=Propionimicrobium sp. PCR01-08-3 TaxID=3052086 RepID=UPI00255CD361|nr:CueP family metal-binding protein [Propionimicrobium sp. PCR01-08-3]WIY83314.1 CueP family metal-binding protein [Propionimicrobium sp. PCR01-08-3]
MKKTARLIVSLLALVLVLSGCSGSPNSGQSADAASGLLERYGLASLSTDEIVEQLDQSDEQRPTELMGSVKPTELLLSDGEEQVSLEMPSDQFYISVAPYLSRTHDCFFHNTGTCQGELADQPVHLNVTGADGSVILDEDVTTYANGFVGFWVPAGSSGTITISQDGKTGSVPFSTGDQDATCITTLKLT